MGRHTCTGTRRRTRTRTISCCCAVFDCAGGRGSGASCLQPQPPDLPGNRRPTLAATLPCPAPSCPDPARVLQALLGAAHGSGPPQLPRPGGDDGGGCRKGAAPAGDLGAGGRRPAGTRAHCLVGPRALLPAQPALAGWARLICVTDVCSFGSPRRRWAALRLWDELWRT